MGCLDPHTDLRAAYDAQGPFCSVYLRAPSGVADAAAQADTRWSNARKELEGQGADPTVLDALGGAVVARHDAGETIVGVAGAEGPLLVTHLPLRVDHDAVVFDTLPRLAPLLLWRHARRPHILVLADRVGADIAVVEPGRPVAAESLEGDEEHIHRGAPGGWSQRRFQQRAENTWEANAAAVADEVASLDRQIGAAFILVAGDVRAVGFLEQHLPATVFAKVEEVAGSRSDEHGWDHLLDGADTMEATIAAAETTELLQRFAQARDADNAAVEGVPATLEALRTGRVDTLLLADEMDARRAWFAGDPQLVAADESAASELGDEPIEGPLADVAIRTADGTDAAVAFVPVHGPHTPADDIGALLRY